MDSAFPTSTSIDDALDAEANKLSETWLVAGAADILASETSSPWGTGITTSTPTFSSFDAFQEGPSALFSDSGSIDTPGLISGHSVPGSVLTIPVQQQQDFRSMSMSISPVFGPNDSEPTARPLADMIIISSDNTVFYVDEYTLFNASNNRFNGRLPLQTVDKQRRILFLQEIVSSEMQVLLQSIYNVPSTDVPDLGTLTRGIAWLPKYGIGAKNHVQPQTRVFDYLLSHAPIQPLEAYICAAMHDIYALAVQVSPYLLRVEPSNITEEMAERMGSRYLLKYFSLHSRRIKVLKELLMKELDLHNVTRDCGFEEQGKLRAQWNQGVAQLSFVLKADTTTTAIRDTMYQTTEGISCPECIRVRDTRLNTILQEWSMASRTI